METEREREHIEDDAEGRGTLDDVLAELQDSDSKVSIYRTERRGRAYLGSWLAEEFSLARVRDTWGGGQYEFRFLDERGRYVTARRQRIAGEPRDPDAEPEPEPERGPGPAELADAVLRLEERFDRMYDDLQRPNPEYNRVDPMQLATSMIGAVQEAIRPAQELLLERARERERDDGSRMAELVEVVRLVRELQTETKPGGSPYDRVLARLGEPIARHLEGSLGPGAGPPSKPAPPPAAAPAPPEPSMIDHAALPDPQNPPQWVGFTAPFLRYLVGWSEAGRDPELRAEVVAEETPVAHWAQIHAELSRPAFLEEFLAAVRGAGDRRMWWESFFGRLREVIDSEPHEADEGPPIGAGPEPAAP